MMIKNLLNASTNEWPDDEFEALFKEQMAYFKPELCSLFSNENPYLHGWLLEEITYSNPVEQSLIRPSIVIRLAFGQDKSELIFLHVCDFMIYSSEILEDYIAHVEEIQKAYILMGKGYVEFVCQYVSGIKLYIKASGIDVQCC